DGGGGREARGMKIEGSHDIPAPRERVWKAFLDPAILARTLPGCEGLDEIGPGEYKAKVKVGVAAIKGSFDGKVRLFDLEPPNRYKMALEGSGGPGFVRGEAGMEVSDIDGGTRGNYSAGVPGGGPLPRRGPPLLAGRGEEI